MRHGEQVSRKPRSNEDHENNQIRSVAKPTPVTDTTGVSNITVASRLNTTVTTEATTNTATSNRGDLPPDACAIHAPHQSKRPSTAHSWDNTSTAARKATTGASAETSLRVSATDTAPIPTTITAAGTAKTASGQPNGRNTAAASTTSKSTAETDSATAALKLLAPSRARKR
jgi:hypothetical protein